MSYNETNINRMPSGVWVPGVGLQQGAIDSDMCGQSSVGLQQWAIDSDMCGQSCVGLQQWGIDSDMCHFLGT